MRRRAEQLSQHETGLDRLAEADVVGEQERHSRHLQGLQDRIELVRLGRDGALPRRDERRAVAGQAGQACHRRPAQRVAERREALRRVRVEPVADAWQATSLKYPRVDLRFPQNRVLTRELPAVEVLNLDEVGSRLVARLASDIANGRRPAADQHGLAGLGESRSYGDHGASLPLLLSWFGIDGEVVGPPRLLTSLQALPRTRDDLTGSAHHQPAFGGLAALARRHRPLAWNR